jgi:alkyl sulfatase BDS1-like metallo-beta-lactamase superfamily hydrolase
MSNEQKPDEPMLASLVRAGDDQREAVKINDFIFMAKDISNAYLVTTADGDVMVNTGFMDAPNVQRNKALFAPVRSGPLRYIILTQAHPDHYGGVPAFREANTKVIAQQRFTDTWQYFHDLGPYLQKRTAKLWASTMRRGSNPAPPPKVVPDIVVDRSYAFELGGRKFEVISTPGGESLCALAVWMPNEKIVFTGNLFGPVFLAMPNLTTTRGDKPRLVVNYLESLDRVRKLGAELLITGHGDPIIGKDAIRASLDKMNDAVTYVTDAVIAGMNAGKTVHELMRETVLPEHLRIGQFHGKVSWAVRAIWEEHSGWFHYDSTTSLYDVPRSSIDADLVELAGGAAALATRAATHLAAGKPLQAIHLLDIALGSEVNNKAALRVKKDALNALLSQSAGSNLSETMWLKSEIADVEVKLAEDGTTNSDK